VRTARLSGWGALRCDAMDTGRLEVPVRVRSRLDLICVPKGVDDVVDVHRWTTARAEWERSGWLVDGAPTAELVDGGGASMRLDVPGARVVYANQLGGFRVWCPACGEGMARPFAKAMEGARTGGPLRAQCAACGVESPFEALKVRPPIRVGRSALVFEDVNGSTLTDAGSSAVEAVLGAFDVVLRRVS